MSPRCSPSCNAAIALGKIGGPAATKAIPTLERLATELGVNRHGLPFWRSLELWVFMRASHGIDPPLPFVFNIKGAAQNVDRTWPAVFHREIRAADLTSIRSAPLATAKVTFASLPIASLR